MKNVPPVHWQATKYLILDQIERLIYKEIEG